MTPELRKEASELILHKRGIRINVQLHVIEADEEVVLRTKEEVYCRLLGLWSVSIGLQTNDATTVLSYLEQHQLHHCLSTQELAFLNSCSADKATPEQVLQCKHRHYAFVFLAWCAGLIPSLHLLPKPISISGLLSLFPDCHQAQETQQLSEQPQQLLNAIRLRRKDLIMDWSDLLYRLHWAVRHASLTHKPSPGNINAELVREWHQTVNWMCNYDEEDNWDLVSTETSA